MLFQNNLQVIYIDLRLNDNQVFSANIDVTSLSSWDDDVVITPVVGCIENSVGDAGICSMMEYLRRVCIVSGSSLSVAHTWPTVEPTCWKTLFSIQNFHVSNFPFISVPSIYLLTFGPFNYVRVIIPTFADFYIKYHFF